MRYAHFICEFAKYPKQTGSLIESSKFLAKKMVEELDGANNVVEFGPGTGSVTTQILKHLPENGQLTCFEINPSFCKHLRNLNDPRLKVINDIAENCEQYVDGLDCIVSGLPLTLFDKPQRDKILAIAGKSKKYIQFQYSPFLAGKMKRYFRYVKIKFVPLNFPPAFVYVCSTSVN